MASKSFDVAVFGEDAVEAEAFSRALPEMLDRFGPAALE
jgi:hypothetical protein